METELSHEWAPVLTAASSLASATTWLQGLADSFEKVVRPDAVAVYLSGLGNVLDAEFSVAPSCARGMAQKLIEQVLPELYATGVETPAALFREPTGAQRRASWAVMRADLLKVNGFHSLTGCFMRSREGCTLGWITLFIQTEHPERATDLCLPLSAVCRAAQTTVQNAISLAETVGARIPKVIPSPLSLREREIAALAARGFSDLNIGQRLEISEGTVGRHLHNIYSKLGVSSRVELLDVLAIPHSRAM